MKYVTPKQITLLSTNVTENDYPSWVSGSSYTVGTYVIRPTLHRIYKCAVATSGTTPPESDTANWVDWGATNAYKMVDEFVNTVTSNSNTITVTFFQAEACDTIAFFNLSGGSVEITMNDGVSDVFNQTYTLDETSILDWSDYFFSEFILRKDLFAVIPFYRNITYTITVTNTGSTAQCGLVVIGRSKDLGLTLFNPTVGLLDYSKKETNEWGGTYLAKGKTAKRAECSVKLDTNMVDEVNRRLAGIAGEATLFLADERDGGFESLLIYGFYRDFDIVIPNPVKSEANLRIEGLI